MPRNGSGNYSLPPVYLATPGTTVRSEQHNIPLQDLAQSMTDSLPRNGSAPMTGNLPMGGRRVTGVGDPTSATDAANRRYVDGAVSPPERLQMSRDGLVGRPQTGSGAAQLIVLGNGIEFNGGLIRAAISDGLAFVGARIAAVVARFATQAEAQAGTNNDAAMTALRVQQYAEANLIGLTQQAWRNVTADRSEGVTYTNNTGRPIMVSISARNGICEVAVPGSGGNWTQVGAPTLDNFQAQSFIVPPTHLYRCRNFNLLGFWSELR